MVKPDDQAVEHDAQPDSRRRIAVAAGELIAESGWGTVTTRAVAERAGVNNALIHYYFGTKDALLFEAAMTSLTETLEVPMSRMFEAPDLVSGLDAFLAASAELDEAQERVVIIFLEGILRGLRDETVGAWMRATMDGLITALETLIAQTQERGEVRADLDRRAAALILGSMLDGLLLYRFATPDFEPARARDALIALIDGWRPPNDTNTEIEA